MASQCDASGWSLCHSLLLKVCGVLASLCAGALLGCAQAEVPAPMPANTGRIGEPVGLLIQGYNYTDDYIKSFTVNGQGGGNLFVSGPSSGGGGSVCCVSYRSGTPLPIRLKVRWMGGYCMEYETSKYGRTNAYPRGLWREADALAVDLSNGMPRALEIHFFPDGHVEAAITRGHSAPRLILPDDETGQRPGIQHKYPDCTDDQLKPAGK